MINFQVEMLGNVGTTDKGYIAQYLVNLPDGKKDVIKVFTKDSSKLINSGKLLVKNDFFFAV